MGVINCCRFTFEKYLLVVAWMLVLGPYCLAQTVQSFDYSNGLSNEKITTICKDKSGLMWIGTEGGLSQFNGYEFVEIAEFKNQTIRAVLYDTLNNMLWVGSSKGLFLFNVKTHSVVNATEKIAPCEVVGIGQHGTQKIVVFRDGQVMRFFETGKVEVIFRASVLKNKYGKLIVGEVAFDENGFLFLLLKMDKTILFSIDLNNAHYERVKMGMDEEVWGINSANGFCVINGENRKIGKYSVKEGFSGYAIPENQSDDPVRRIQYIHGEYFISYRESYARYKLNEETSAWKLIEKGALNRVLKSKNIRLFYIDDKKVLWLGTSKGIIRVFTNKKYPFERMLSEPDKTVSVRQIVAGKPRQLFIATYDGIYDYDKLTGETKLLSNIPKDVGFPSYARTLLYDQGRYLYAGTESSLNSFYRYNLETHEFESRFFREQNAELHINSVFSLMRDRKGTIWMATDIGLASFNDQNGLLTVHNEDKFSVGIKRLMFITPATNPNQFLVCGNGGAYLVDIENGVKVSYDLVERLGTTDFECLFATEDTHHQVWIGTLKHGVVVLDVNDKAATVINKSDGLASDEVYSILWQQNGIAWMSTSNGLSRYDLRLKRFQNYFYENGIADDEFNQHSFYKDSDSLMYIGGVNGITYFNPLDFKAENNKVNIFLANTTRWSAESKSKLISFNDKEIVMNPADYLITLNFGLNDFAHPESNTFYYRINQINNTWISLGTDNSLTLNGLAPGEYQILVKGINHYGFQSTDPLQFSMVVKERIYKTSWFYVLLTLALLSVVYYYFRWRLNRITQRQLLRTQISSNLHDEVGSLLTQIVISTEGAIYTNNSIEEKNKRLSKIANLSRNAINTMSDVLWSIDSRNDFVGNLTDRIREHAELMFADKEIEVEFEFNDTRVSKTIDSQIRQHVYLIFKEAIHNIVKHSKADRVSVIYKQTGSKFELVVANNNHLKALSEPKMLGQGIRNMNMRAKKINASCTIEVISDWYTVSVRKN
jgi:ligand-binding sensor domain-containing protein